MADTMDLRDLAALPEAQLKRVPIMRDGKRDENCYLLHVDPETRQGLMVMGSALLEIGGIRFADG